MYVQVIGNTVPNGQAGSYARQPDMIINTKAAAGEDNIPFGAPLAYSGTGVVQMGASATAAQFLGVAAREVKTAVEYATQDVGQYAPGEAVPVFQRGCINVKCQKGTPAANGAVYVRVAANAAYSTAAVGGFEAEADSTNTVQLTNAKWAGPADANGVAELRIMTIINS